MLCEKEPDSILAAIRDPRFPISRIADSIEPYLRMLLARFEPHEVILFGSYVYGNPQPSSDVDILVVKPLTTSPVREARRIREAWRPLRQRCPPPAIDLIVESLESHEDRKKHSAGFYNEILERGLRIK